MNKDNKKFIVETIFLKESLKQDLTLKEFIILMYFDNEYDGVFDVKKISKATCLNEKDVLASFGSLLDKKLLVLNSEKNESGKLIDKVSLDNLYKGIKESEKPKEKEKNTNSLFIEFQKAYAKTLSSMDYELINAWLKCGYSESLILGALKEANYNGKSSLRYIDKILYEWNKKGFKTMDDVNKYLTKREDSSKLFDTKVLEYNWLDEE